MLEGDAKVTGPQSVRERMGWGEVGMGRKGWIKDSHLKKQSLRALLTALRIIEKPKELLFMKVVTIDVYRIRN